MNTLKYIRAFLSIIIILSVSGDLSAQETAVPPDGGDNSGGGSTEIQRPPTPTVSSNYCGEKVLRWASGSGPESGVAWFWQSTTGGGYSELYDGSKKTIDKTGTYGYYIRPFKVSSQTWGPPSSTVTFTARMVEAPEAQDITVNVNGCQSAVLSFTPRSGETWYWQSADGTFNNSASTYTVYRSGTYYLKARNNANQCWSAVTEVPVQLAGGPAAPPSPSVSYHDGVMTLTRIDRDKLSTIWYYWKDSNGNNLGTAKTITGNVNSTYYLYAYDEESQCWSSGTGAGANPDDIPPAPAGITVSTNGCGPKTLTVTQPSSAAKFINYWQGKDSNGHSAWGDSDYTANTDGTYYVRGKHKYKDIWGPNASITVDVNPNPVAPIAVNKKRYGAGFAKFETTDDNGLYYWYKQSSDTNPINAEPSATITELISTTTIRYAQSYTDEGCYSNKIPVQVEVLTFPQIAVIGQSQINFKQEYVELTVTEAFDQYQWYKNGKKITGATERNYKAASAGFYTIGVKNQGFNDELKSDPHRVAHMLEDENKSYTITTQVLVPGAKSKGDVIRLDSKDKVQTISYYDEYNRPDQVISIGTSPAGNDIIQGHSYDENGRESKSYLPFTRKEGIGLYLEDWEDQLALFYQKEDDGIANTDKPYAEVEFENSPNDRILRSGSVGEAWQLDGNHTKSYKLGLNYTNHVVGRVSGIRNWKIDGQTGLPVSTSVYGSGMLFKKTITDEEGSIGTVYTSSLGLTVLKVMADGSETYSIHDHMGRLRFVLQPELVGILQQAESPFSPGLIPSAQQIENLAFQYQYDGKGRLTATKAPGADWVYMVYDNYDRPILSQDGNQRVNEQWLFAKYDLFGRAVISGMIQDASSREELQAQIDQYYDQNISWTQMNNVIFENNHLEQTIQSSDWGESGAATGTVLQQGQNGTLSFRVNDLNSKFMIGFSNDDTDAHYNTIDYAIHIDKTVFYVYQNGSRIWSSGSVTPGDIYQIQRNGNNLYFRVNGSVFYEINDADANSFIVDVAMHKLGGKIEINIEPDNYENRGYTHYGYTDMAFPQVVNKAEILNVIYYDNYDFPHAAEAEYAFVPSKENSTYFDRIDGLGTGAKTRVLGTENWINSIVYYDEDYQVIQSTSSNQKQGFERVNSTYDFTGKMLNSTLDHEIPMTIIWKNMENVAKEGAIITATGINNWTSGMSSANTLRQNEDGWLETTVVNINDNKVIGFSEVDLNTSLNDIDYAAYINGKSLRAHRLGSFKKVIQDVEPGDNIKMTRINGIVGIWVNNIKVYEFPETSTSELVIDISLFNSYTQIGYINCSFGIPTPVQGPYQVIWAARHGNSFISNKLTKTHNSNSWDIGGSYSFNKLPEAVDGFVAFEAGQIDIDKALGLAQQDQGSRYNDIDYAFYLQSDQILKISEKGEFVYEYGEYAITDQLKIEREGGTIKYYVNGQAVYSSLIPSYSPLIVDASIFSQGGFFNNVITSFSYVQPRVKSISIAQNYDYDRVGRLLNTTHEIKEQVRWATYEGLEVGGDNSLTHIGQESYDFSGAYGQQFIAKDRNGAFEVTAETMGRILIGLNDEPEGTGYLDMDYALYMPQDSELYIYENGTRKTEADGLETYQVGDKLSIVKKNGKIHYQKNGSTFYTSKKSVTTDLYPDVTTFYAGDKISEAMISTEGEVMLAEYHYNELGQLIRKDLHRENENDLFAQYVDFSYHIRGWLKSINDASLSPTSFVKDYWGMELSYDGDAGTGNTAYFDGKVSAMKTSFNQGLDEIKEEVYNFSYDNQKRLTQAGYKAKSLAGWTSSEGYYNVEGIQYDRNGNIRQLKRFAGYGRKTKIDDLTYDYKAGTHDFSNRLAKVDDESIARPSDQGFKDVEGEDYMYDANGNVISDNNKGIASVSYNYLNMPEQIVKTDGSKITFAYSASGSKLAKMDYDASGKLIRTTDYIGAFTYENDTLQYIHHKQGRILRDQVNGGWEYQYNLSDHLGNVRTVFTTKEKVLSFKATMETENDHEESQMFVNLGKSRAVDVDAVSGDEVSRLNSAQMTGPGLSLPVYPGDKVDLKVYGYHRGGTGNANPVDVGDFIVSLAGAFGGLNGGDMTEQAIYNLTDQAINPANGGIGLMGTTDDARPAAYLNYILFDKNYNMHQHGHAQIPAGANTRHTMVLDNITSDIEGFIYIYLSNESNTLNEVYFDDLEVTLTEGKVVQSNSYYPFGMKHNSSWTRTTQRPNKFGFNGGSEYNDYTDTYDTPFRQYDPATGRFNGVDALAHSMPMLTPYRFGFNNPVSFNDPSGLFEKPYELTFMDKKGGSILTGAENLYSLARLSRHIGPGSGHHWSDILYGALGAAGMERNARVMSGNTFERYYNTANVTDERKAKIANSAAVQIYGKIGSVEVGGYIRDKYGPLNQSQAADASRFYFFPKNAEAQVYKWMMEQRDAARDGKGAELVAFLSENQDGEEGILVFPWYGNKNGSADDWINYVNRSNMTVEAFMLEGRPVYQLLLLIHTHYDSVYEPSPEDYSTAESLKNLGINSIIISDTDYMLIDPSIPRSSHEYTGFMYEIYENDQSLFNYLN